MTAFVRTRPSFTVRVSFALVGVLTACSAAFAQPAVLPTEKIDELVTDRPDFTESSEVVAKGLLQFESGIAYEGDTRDGVRDRSVSVPSALLRLGLGRRTELRISGDGFLSDNDAGVRTSGASDLELGVKVRLLDEKSAGFDLAVIPMASFPTGAAAFTSGAVDPTLKVTWARGLGAGWDVNGNVNVSSLSDESGRFTQRAMSASFGHDLPAGWGGFVEVYGFSPMTRGDGAGVTLDWGVARQLGHDLHVDLAMGRGLTAAAPDWFVTVGFAVRGRLSAR